MTALYLERYLNYGLTRAELTSGKPIIGIAQTGSDLSPCNRHHLELAQRVREGIRDAGGIAFEFPVHPIQETGKRPTAALDRNLAYLGLVEVLFGYPLDGVVLMTGCDKTTPACLMAAATVNTPAIVLSGGPMLDGYHDGKLAGSGTVIWQARQDVAAGKIDYDEFIDIVAVIGAVDRPLQHHGHGVDHERAWPRRSACRCPAAPRSRRRIASAAKIAYETGLRAVEIVREDLKPSDILTRAAFENAIVACSAIGGSTNAPIHLNAHRAACRRAARHRGLGENRLRRAAPRQHAAGRRISRRGLFPRRRLAGGDARTARRQTASWRRADHQRQDRCRKRGAGESHQCQGHPALRQAAEGASRLQGAARQSVRFRDHEDERDLRRIPPALSVQSRRIRMPSKAAPWCSTARRTITARIDDPALGIDEHTILFMRGAGPIGYPGSAEVVNMQPPAALIKKGVTALACIGDGRQSGTSGSPSILNASPEAAAGGGLALLQTGDRVRIDLNKGTADMLISGRGTGGAARGAAKERRLSLSAEPDAVAGNPARHGRSARRRHGAAAGGQISARRAEIRAARQSLTLAPMRRLMSEKPSFDRR